MVAGARLRAGRHNYGEHCAGLLFRAERMRRVAVEVADRLSAAVQECIRIQTENFRLTAGAKRLALCKNTYCGSRSASSSAASLNSSAHIFAAFVAQLKR